jgi:dolichol-phosphate mannosyltransferase
MISVVIPVANEQATVAPLCRALAEAVPPPYELLFVDDGSTDGTWEELQTLHQPGQVRALRFRRNFGKTAALRAGFAAARGDIIFTMDGDLQDDPREIPRFLARLEQGYDLVSGWKRQRRDPLNKVIASRIFNATVAWLSGLPLHDVNCGFKAYRGEVARNLRLRGEMHRFTPLLAAALGYRVSELVVAHHPRRYGRSHYGLSRLLKGFLDLFTVLLVTRYAERPSHGFGLAAVVALAAGAVFLLAVPLWLAPLTIVAFVLIALVLVAAGLVAEIVVQRGVSEAPPVSYIREQLD